MINHMEDVAKMYGLNIGDAFRIADDENNIYHLPVVSTAV